MAYPRAAERQARTQNRGDTRARAPTAERSLAFYKGRRLASDLRVDLLVAGLVVVECKATGANNPVFEAQALTYLRLMDLRLAFVINFGQRLVKDGVSRVVNGS